MPHKGFTLTQIASAEFIGGDWEEIHNEQGHLVGIKALGTNCTITYVADNPRPAGGVDSGVFHIPADERVSIAGGLVSIPWEQDQ